MAEGIIAAQLAGDWFVEAIQDSKGNRIFIQRLNADGTPVYATVLHEHVDYRREADARTKGYEAFNTDPDRGDINDEPPWTKIFESYTMTQKLSRPTISIHRTPIAKSRRRTRTRSVFASAPWSQRARPPNCVWPKRRN